MKPKNSLLGPALIALTSLLWATDALVRMPAVGVVSSTFIVLSEHLLAVLFLLPWILSRHPGRWWLRDKTQWASAALVGVGGSAIAMVLFTESFKYVNPSVAILLQKLQPIVVVGLAFAFLGERPARGFYLWAVIALFCGTVISFPDLDFGFLTDPANLKAKGVLYSLGAAALWAVSTIAGKVLLKKTPTSVATFWRFLFGLLALTVMELAATGGFTQSFKQAWGHTPTFFALLYMSLIPGLFAMVAYYAGLEKTPASIVTIVELLFPIGAVILNTLFLGTSLNAVQALSGAGLLFAVTMISLAPRYKK